jgi:hypothetical protein
MTSSPVGRLLISHITLRGPELRQLYELVARQGALSHSALVAMLVPCGHANEDMVEAPLREALSFLTGVGLLARQGANRRAVYHLATKAADQPFALVLLRKIRAHPDLRQQAISLVHDQLVADDLLHLTANEVRERMERGSHGDLFAWTGEKIGLWTHIADFVGLIRRLERTADLVLVPQPELVLAALHWAQQQVGNTSLDKSLHLIDTALFACYTQRGRVHRGLTQTLLMLEQFGGIQLGHNADAARSVLLSERRVSDCILQEAR